MEIGRVQPFSNFDVPEKYMGSCYSADADGAGLGGGLGICISHCLPGDVDMLALGPHLGQVIQTTLSDPLCLHHLRTGPGDFPWNIQSHDAYSLRH